MFVVDLPGDLVDFAATEEKKLSEVVTSAINRAAAGLRKQIEGEIKSKLKGDRLSKAVRARIYPQGRNSLSAAGLVYVAADWINTHIEGAVINAAGGHYLAIPLPAAEALGYDKAAVDRTTMGRFSKGSGAGNAMVAAAARDFGKLFFLPGKNGGVLAAKTKGGVIPLFALRRQVRLKQSLDVERFASEWLSRLADDISTRLGE